jgi:tripartite-type tricarboxylate transporter receptor subunit TctC
MLARPTAQRLQERLGATAVVKNKTGGAGVVGTREVLGAAPDGHTPLASAFNTAVMPLVLRNANFHPQTDSEVCARTAQAPLVMAIAGSRPRRMLAEVIEAGKARPRDWTIAITSLGAASHLATIELNRRTGPVTGSIAETRRFIAAEIVRAGDLLRSVNYRPE